MRGAARVQTCRGMVAMFCKGCVTDLADFDCAGKMPVLDSAAGGSQCFEHAFISCGEDCLSETGAPARERATAQMVAERAKVSRVAVSRAFNPHTSLKPEKRELILRIAQELNYTPDRAA